MINIFQLGEKEAEKTKEEVLSAVRRWETAAQAIGIGRGEQQLMAAVFNV